jgi:hypothetical protein
MYLGEEALPARNLTTTLPMFILGAILIAPLFEEITFRGFYTKAKALRIIALILLPVFLVLGNVNWVYFNLLGTFLLTYGISLFKSDERRRNLSFLMNAALFASIHWELEGFSSLFLPLNHFGFGLILIWTVLNYGLLKAVFTHALFNMITILLLLASLQFPDTTLYVKETDTYRMEWNRVPLSEGGNVGQLKYSKTGAEIGSMNARQIHSLLLPRDNVKNGALLPSEPFMKYRIDLVCRDTVKVEEVNEIILKEMLSAGILIEKPHQ